MENNESVLKMVEKKISLKIPDVFEPKEFFKNREGLYVWSGFTNRILSKASTVKKGTSFSISSFELLKNANDDVIEKELLGEHLFDESGVCAVIADLIAKQPKGEEGTLQNNGYWNLFYTKDFVVHVLWYADGRHWYVGTWGRGGHTWHVDSRVFSPAN